MCERRSNSAALGGYEGKVSVVGDAVRAWRAGTAEVFMPLSQPAGQAQVDFGEAVVRLKGKETKIAFFVMSLPFSDAFCCQAFPRECTENFQEGHCRAFQFFSGVPRRISYDNSRIAVAKFVGRRGDTPTQEFLRLESHFLFEHHFCLVRRANEKGHVEGWSEVGSSSGISISETPTCRAIEKPSTPDLTKDLNFPSIEKRRLDCPPPV